MGDRRDVVFEFGEGKTVVLYSHWQGSTLQETLAEALNSNAARSRYGDPSYLCRILISQIIGEQWEGALNWGISPEPCGDAQHDPIVVDLVTRQVRIGTKCWSFLAFVACEQLQS